MKKISRKKATRIQAVGGYVLLVITLIRGLLLIPLYISFIGAHLYGLWLASGGILVWLSMMDLGIGRGLTQRIASHYGKKDYDKAGQYFLNGLLLYSILGGLIFLIGYLLSFPLPAFLKAKTSEAGILRGCFQLAVFSNVLYIINNLLRGFATSLLRPLFPLISLFVWTLLGISCTIYLLYNEWGLWAIPIGHLVSQSGVTLFNGGYSLLLLKNLGSRFGISKTILSDLKSIIPSLFGAKIGESIVKNIEPMIITIILYPELATAFTITRRAADIVSQGLHVIIGSTFPSLVHLFGGKDMKRSVEVVRMIILIAVFGGLIGIGAYIVGNGTFVNLWVGEEFYLGQVVTILIGAGIMLRVIHNFMVEILIGAGDIIFSTSIILAESLSRVGTMVVLVYLIGVIGAPLGMILTCSIFAIILGFRLNKQMGSYPIFPRTETLILSSIISVSIITFFVFFYREVSTWFSFGIFISVVFISLFIGNFFVKDLRLLIYEITGWKLIYNKFK